MNVTFNKINDVTAEVIVKIEAKDYADKVKKQIKEIGKQRPEPGFRQGHVPAGILEKKYGKAVKYDVVNKEVSDALFNYIQENKLRVLGNPVPRKNDDFNLDNDDFTFEFEVGLAPEIKSPVNKELTVPYYTIEVTDEMIDKQDEAMRRRFGKQESGDTVDATALVKGVITELDENGAPKADGIVQENGIVAPQYFKSDDQRNLFIGKHVGDVVVFNPAATCDTNPAELSSMLGVDKEKAASYTGNFSMDIKDIIVLNPAQPGEEYYEQAFGKDKVHDEKEYREALKNMIAASLAADSDYRFTIDAKDAIMKAVGDIDLPAEVLKDFLKMQNDGMTDEEAEKTFEDAVPSLKWDLVRDAVAEQLQIKVDDQDIREIARAMARRQFAQYGMNNVPEDVVDRYADDVIKDKRYHEQLVNQALDHKLFNGIRASVTIDDKNVSVDQFNALFAPAV